MTTLFKSLLLGAREARQRQASFMALALVALFTLPACTVPINKTHSLQVAVRLVANDEILSEAPTLFNGAYIDPTLIDFSSKQSRWDFGQINSVSIEEPTEHQSTKSRAWKQRKGAKR